MLTLLSIFFGAFFSLGVAWLLGRICMGHLPVPRTIELAVGAVAESCLIFLLLLAGFANRITFALVAVACAALLWRFGRREPYLADSGKLPDRVTGYLTGTILALYGVLYLINAMGPEVQPDAAGYHLGLVSEYLRLGGFPNRVGFYEIAPQGLEMLFVPAFVFGRHSAAKLVHFAFLLATVPVMLSIGRRLELPAGAAWSAAILYLCAPVVGVSGTAAYTDAALVFFVVATCDLLLAWRGSGDARYLLPAGITAGFCYAIKMPGIAVLLLALAFVAWNQARRRAAWSKPLAVLAGGALAVMAPWILRAAVMTGNPVAPLLNWIFPNAYFHPLTERELTGSLSSLAGIPPWRVPYELALGGRFDGILGPVCLALPFGLLALRRRAGRLCWVAAGVLALPWFGNSGARFLMPALPFLALALVVSFPKPAIWACLALQAAACWPQVINFYDGGRIWRLRGIPWQAALRIEPEHEYLWRTSDDYKVARILEHDTHPGERIFSLISVATAYTDREVLQFWHSAQAVQLNDTLRIASLRRKEPFFEVRADWAPRPVWGLRIRAPQASPAEWCIHDLMLFHGEDKIFGSPQWRLRAWPNVWEVPLMFDENQATCWRTWRPVRPGMFVQAEFDRAQVLSGLVMTSHTPFFHVPFELYARGQDGWRLLTDRPDVVEKQLPDLRPAAIRAFHNAGFQYLLAASGDQGNGLLGAAIAGHESEWNLVKVGYAGTVALYRIQ